MLLETLKIVNRTIPFLEFHNERLNHARKILFNAQDKIDLKDFIQFPSQMVFRCRIIYSKTIKSIEYLPYKEQKILSVSKL
ncbi:hypothetical protein QUF82_03520 [Thiotrichales bacterium HSG14]|nr:hypothetical protein [Thiotrichales bacterium HSG14]